MGKPDAGHQKTLQTIIDFLPSAITMFDAEQQMVVGSSGKSYGEVR